MSIRVYEPPEDASSVPVETEAGVAGARRQIVRTPQTEAAVSALQTAVAADSASEQALLTAIRDLTTTIRDNQLRRTDPLSAGTNILGKVGLDAAQSNYITDSKMQSVSAGSVRIAGAAFSLTASQTASWQVENPVGSGMLLIITGWRVWCDQPTNVRFTTGATASGSVATPVNANLGVTTPGVAVIRAGVNQLTGGTTLQPEARANPNAPYVFDGVIVVPPGQQYAMSVVAPTGLGSSMQAAGSTYWTERPV